MKKILIFIVILFIGCNSVNNDAVKASRLGNWELSLPENAKIQRNSDSTEM